MEYSYQFSEELQQEWEWSERYATQPRSSATSSTSPSASTCAATSSSRRACLSATFDDAPGALANRDRSGPATAFVLHHGDRLPLLDPHARDRGDRHRYEGELYHTGPVAPRGCRLHGQAVGVIGTGSSGVQVDPDLIAEQAEHAHRLPAHRRPMRYPPTTPPGFPDYQQSTSRSATPSSGPPTSETFLGFGSDYPTSDELAGEATPEEREAALPGALGARRPSLHGRLRTSSRAGRPTRPPPSSSATRSADIVEDPKMAASCSSRIRCSAASASASTPATTRPSIVPTSRWST